jgi:hypothetical protein
MIDRKKRGTLKCAETSKIKAMYNKADNGQ